ncbi:MAG: FtsW/RodA/SpoVE family cell cycle protein [Bacteroidota bacterium]
MKIFLHKYFKGDTVIWVITLILLSLSLLTVYSFVPILVKIEGGTPFKYLFKHLVYVLLALLTMVWVHKKDPILFSKFARFGFYVAIGLLIFTFFFGTKVNDAGRWIKIPFVGLTFQSSDFAKLALIVYVSKLLAKKKDVLNSWKDGFWPIMFPIIVICGLIVKDNLSTAAIVFAISFTLLFIGKVPFGKLFSLIGGGVLLLSLVVAFHLAVPSLNILPRYETWENRIMNRMDATKDIVENAQSLNAELAIYNGGFFGQGVGDGKLKEYIPEAYADFYYASFVEEFGMISSLVLILAYLILLYRIIRIALKSDKLFETYMLLGIGILILSQASVNMLVCTGVFPVTGQNMPLLAMGGSGLIMTCLALGIVQSVAYSQQKKNEKAEINENVLTTED